MESGSGSQLSGSQMNPYWIIPDGYAFSNGGAPNEYLLQLRLSDQRFHIYPAENYLQEMLGVNGQGRSHRFHRICRKKFR